MCVCAWYYYEPNMWLFYENTNKMHAASHFLNNEGTSLIPNLVTVRNNLPVQPAVAMVPRISPNRDLQLELAFHLEVSTVVDAHQSQIGST